MAKTYRRPDEWEKEFQKWKTNIKYAKESTSERIFGPIKQRKEPASQVRSKNKNSKWIAIVLMVFGLAIFNLLIFSVVKGSSSLFSAGIIFLIILLIIFVFALFSHKAYEKLINKINPSIVLAVSFVVIIINMFFSPRFYSLEWAFLAFLAITVVFYDFKIDSRFLILFGLVLLGFVPFLLLGAQNVIAETVAVYVYYFLVVGVALQIVEYYRKTENSVGLSEMLKRINREKALYAVSIWGVITIIIIIYNRFSSVELVKWSSVYFFVLLAVVYAVLYFQEQ